MILFNLTFYPFVRKNVIMSSLLETPFILPSGRRFKTPKLIAVCWSNLCILPQQMAIMIVTVEVG